MDQLNIFNITKPLTKFNQYTRGQNRARTQKNHTISSLIINNTGLMDSVGDQLMYLCGVLY